MLTGSFAVPFEEDERDPKTFFLDLDYVEEMWRMFRKVNGECLLVRGDAGAGLLQLVTLLELLLLLLPGVSG